MTKKNSPPLPAAPVDPHFEREAQKYTHPIASRELILVTLLDAGSPLDFIELAETLSLTDEEALEALRRRLRAMERDGQVLCNRRGGYLPVNQADLIRGRVTGHPDGFGFLIPDDQSEDLFLSPRQMRGVLHGDRVLGRVVGIDHRGRREGGIIEVLERASEQLVGRIRVEDGVGIVTPDNKRIAHDILVPPDHLGRAQDDQIVVVRLRPQPSRKARLCGEVVEVLGEHMAPGMEIDIAIRAHGLPFEWPESVTEAAGHLGTEVPTTARRGRLDLRDKPLVTIDGEDARDFDDALYCEPIDSGWRLWVAIADVAHYVHKDDALDTEARLRGTSVYFPQKVVPMLPEVLSNGLCSLNPGVERLCMICEMEIGKRGALRQYRFHEGVMRSHARLTYTEVAQILVEQDPEVQERYAPLLPHLQHLHAVYQVLSQARQRRGAIDFESTETRIEFGEARKIERIMPVVRNDAHRLVEECMIAANVSAARFLKKKRLPALYRVHDRPPPQKVDDLRTFLGGVGLTLEAGETVKPAHYAAVLRAAAGRPDQRLIQTVILRSMSQAVYAPTLLGHFGLALEDYAHFTSPIRRYPDLLVHRAIRHALRGGKPSQFAYSATDMETLGEHCSMTERRADDATRDAVAWLKAEYMQDKVGEQFPGVVSAVTGFGLFVEIAGVLIEGLVHVATLDNDFYHFDPLRHRLTGQRSGRSFGIGDPVEVQVVRVSLDDRKIDLRLLTATQESSRSRKKATKAAKDAKSAKAPAQTPPPPHTAPPATAEAVTEPASRRRGRRTRNLLTSEEPLPAVVLAADDAPPAPTDAPAPTVTPRRGRRRRQGFQSSEEVALLIQPASAPDPEPQLADTNPGEAQATSTAPEETDAAPPATSRRRRKRS